MPTYRQTVLIGESVDYAHNLFGVERRLGHLMPGISTFVELIEIVGIIKHLFAPRHAAIVINEYISHYRENPSFEIRVIDKLALVVKNPKACLLQQVACPVLVGSERLGEIEHILLKFHQFVM